MSDSLDQQSEALEPTESLYREPHTIIPTSVSTTLPTNLPLHTPQQHFMGLLHCRLEASCSGRLQRGFPFRKAMKPAALGVQIILLSSIAATGKNLDILAENTLEIKEVFSSFIS